jgi:hypothetical protein
MNLSGKSRLPDDQYTRGLDLVCGPARFVNQFWSTPQEINIIFLPRNVVKYEQKGVIYTFLVLFLSLTLGSEHLEQSSYMYIF